MSGKSPKEWYEGQVAVTAEPIPKNGEVGNGRSSDNVRPTQFGNSADYTRRRLARDRPDLLEKVAQGEVSLNQAAIEAGFRKKPTPFEIVKAQASLVAARIANRGDGGDHRTKFNTELSNKEAADLLKVSECNVDKAKAFLANAEPALVKLVEAGKKHKFVPFR